MCYSSGCGCFRLPLFCSRGLHSLSLLLFTAEKVQEQNPCERNAKRKHSEHAAVGTQHMSSYAAFVPCPCFCTSRWPGVGGHRLVSSPRCSLLMEGHYISTLAAFCASSKTLIYGPGFSSLGLRAIMLCCEPLTSKRLPNMFRPFSTDAPFTTNTHFQTSSDRFPNICSGCAGAISGHAACAS